MVPGVVSGSRKRDAEDQGDRDDDQRGAPVGENMDQDLASWHQDLVETRRQRPEKRSALDNPPKGEEIQQQRIGDGPMDAEDQDVGLMVALEEAEKKTLHISTSEWCMPMITCEEPVEVSY